MAEGKSPRLYLFPVELSEVSINRVIPTYNIEVIRTVKHFIVENVRSARRFLKRCDRSIDIDSLTFYTLNQHTHPEEIAAYLEPMEQGFDMGIISEAGCPAVADPGADVVAIAQRKGITVVPLVGPSSILMALMGSGFNGQRFTFRGYLPIEGGARSGAFKDMASDITRNDCTQIFIETPYRNNKLVEDLCRQMPGNMRLCIASDITGERESIITLPISEWSKRKFDYSKIPTIFLLYKG